MAIYKAADIWEMALEIEKSGELFYGAVAKKAKSPEVAALFEDLAEQEVLHYATFKKLSQTTWDLSEMPAGQWDEYLLYLQATIQSTFFEGRDKALSLADEVTDQTQALRLAMGFEKETLLFFYDLRDMVSAADRDTITRIVEEEKRHIKRLGTLLQQI